MTGTNKDLNDVLRAYDADLPLAEASTIPGDWYTDPRIAELERKTVWSKTWQLVARADQVKSAGQYVTTEIAGEPIIVVRGHDNVLRAFFNVCRHHAAAVMTEPAGRADRLRCPYHGWTYDLTGALKSASELDGVCRFALSENGLVPCPVTEWEGLVFAALAGAPPLEAQLGPMAEKCRAIGLSNLQFYARREWEIACNWKVFVDNYLDGGYHVPFLHRDLNRALSFSEYKIETFERTCLQSSAVAASESAASFRKGTAHYMWIYPNLMLNAYEGYLDTNLVVPLAVDRTKVIFDFYFADVVDAAREGNDKSVEMGERIQREDLAICESVQRGLGSRAYSQGRLSVKREAGEHLFHRLLAHDLRSGV